MKRFLFVLLVFIFFPCVTVYGQVFFDAVIAATLQASHAEQVIHYAQMVSDNIMQIEQFRQMIENTGKQMDMAVQNLASIKDIGSWDDFMDFYNRQLYLERQTMQAYDNMNVTIGKKQYHISEINNIGGAMKDEYIDYWNKEFT